MEGLLSLVNTEADYHSDTARTRLWLRTIRRISGSSAT